MRKTPELLAPAGDLAAVRAAVCAGANAVYFGGKAFNARASAGNLSADEIAEAVRVCHRHGVRTFLTLNTLIKEEEWADFEAYAREVLPLGIDAVIVQDFAVADFVKSVCPAVELHASTQMAVHDADGAKLLYEHGFTRAVLARELSLSELRAIREACPIELEVFIHGALCCSYSGRCLLSSFHGGRSGNRGQCAGACRLPYRMNGKTGYPMNLKDLCTLDLLGELARAGIASLKIEGRLKGIPYIYGVIAIYRKYLDLYAQRGVQPEVEPKDLETLMQLYNRGAFTKGYLTDRKEEMLEPATPKHQGIRIGTVKAVRGSEITLSLDKLCSAGDVLEIRTAAQPYPTIRLASSMISGKTVTYKADKGPAAGDSVYRLTDAALGEELLAKASEVPDAPLSAEAWVYPGSPMRLALKNVLTGRTATVTGQVPEPATGRPLSEEDLAKSLSKFGGTGYSLSAISVHTDGGSFVPVSALNALRREALALLEDCGHELTQPSSAATPKEGENNAVHISFETKEQWRAILDTYRGDAVLMPALALEDPELAAETLARGFSLAPSLPYISRGRNEQKEALRLARWTEAGATGFEAHHLGQVKRITDLGLALYLGWGFGIMNRRAASIAQNEGACAFLVSPELNAEETKQLAGVAGASLYTYGRIPLMITEQCFHKTAKGCSKSAAPHTEILTDRIGARLIAQSICDYCYNVLYDEKPIYLGDKKVNGLSRRLSFTVESAEETSDVLARFNRHNPLPESGRGHYNNKVL